MKTVNADVMWYESRGDGDNYSEDVEITDEEYKTLRKYFRNNDCDDICSEDIEDPDVKEIVERIEEEASSGLKDNSYDSYQMYVEEAEENDEEEVEDFDEWYDRFTTSAQLTWEQPEEHTFTINISNGGESELEFYVYEDELELIEKADEECENYENVEGLEDFYKDIMEDAKTKLEEDLDLTGDNPAMLDELSWTITLSD